MGLRIEPLPSSCGETPVSFQKPSTTLRLVEFGAQVELTGVSSVDPRVERMAATPSINQPPTDVELAKREHKTTTEGAVSGTSEDYLYTYGLASCRGIAAMGDPESEGGINKVRCSCSRILFRTRRPSFFSLQKAYC